MAVRTEQVDGALVESVCARVRERIDDRQAAEVEEFVRQFYRWVPAEDLAGRSTLDLYGAAVAHWNLLRAAPAGRGQGPRLQPALRAARLAVDAHRRRGRQRRHAVPRRLGRHGAQPARLRHPPLRPPGHARPARRRTASSQHVAARRRRRRRGRVGHPRRDRPPDRPRRAATTLRDELLARARRRARRRRGLAAHDRAGARAGRRARATRPHPVDDDEREEANALLEWLADDHFDVPRLPRVRRSTDERRRGPAARDAGHRARHPAQTARGTARVRGVRPPARARARAGPAASACSCSRRPTRARPSTAPRTWTTSASSASTRTARSSASGASSGSTRRQRVQGAPARHPAAAAQDRARARARGLPARTATTRRRSSTILEALPARRAVPDRRRTSCSSWRSAILALGERRQRAAVRAPRRVRALPVVPRLPPARALQHAEPRAHRRASCARRSAPRASTSRCA